MEIIGPGGSSSSAAPTAVTMQQQLTALAAALAAAAVSNLTAHANAHASLGLVASTLQSADIQIDQSVPGVTTLRLNQAIDTGQPAKFKTVSGIPVLQQGAASGNWGLQLGAANAIGSTTVTPNVPANINGFPYMDFLLTVAGTAPSVGGTLMTFTAPAGFVFPGGFATGAYVRGYALIHPTAGGVIPIFAQVVDGGDGLAFSLNTPAGVVLGTGQMRVNIHLFSLP